MTEHKTAGELSVQAASDPTAYNSMDVALGMVDDIAEQIQLCIERHKKIINEDEFCVIMLLVSDPLIKNVQRRKFYAWPYMPKPRPNQSVFLYRRANESVSRLWVLPEAFCMAALSSKSWVAPQWETMKQWSDAFFNGTFYETIRKQHQIDLLSEEEYLDLHREELIEACGNNVAAPTSQSFDFSKIGTNKVIDAAAVSSD